MIEIPVWLVITILVNVPVAVISFIAGVRYCGRKMLPGLVAAMTDEEMDQFADTVAAERAALTGEDAAA